MWATCEGTASGIFSSIVSESLGSLPHSEAIASVAMVMSWSSFGPLVTSWSSLGATPAIPSMSEGLGGPLGAVHDSPQ